MENIGRKLQIVRELHNFTQSFVADKIGLTQTAYARLEQKDKIAVPILEKIAEEVYQIEPNKIIHLPTDPKVIIHTVCDNHGIVGHVSNVTFHQDKKTEKLEQELDKIKGQLEILLELFNEKKTP